MSMAFRLDFPLHLLFLFLLVSQASSSLVPAVFIFGDSLADAGNNNNLLTLAKANFPPYGRSYPGNIPTGRFSNGFNAVDFICFKLGLPLIPIYNDPATKGRNILKGVNYASGASGIENYSGSSFGEVISLDQQIDNFLKTKAELEDILGRRNASRLLASSPFSIITANNDWLNTYLFPYSPLSAIYTFQTFREELINKFSSQMKKLYAHGARRFVVSGLGALGCVPSQLNRYHSNGSCIQFLNDIAMDYNQALRHRLHKLEHELPGADFLFINLYVSILEAFHNPSAYGLKYHNKACCGIGEFGGLLICTPQFPVCHNEEEYLFWDAYHPTQKVLKQIVDQAWEKGPPYSYPTSGREALTRHQ